MSRSTKLLPEARKHLQANKKLICVKELRECEREGMEKRQARSNQCLFTTAATKEKGVVDRTLGVVEGW